MGSIQSLNFYPSSKTTSSCISRTINELLEQVSMIDDVSDKLRNLDHFIQRLEAEMKKIDGFKRDLPLCIFLLNDAIRVLKNETVQCRKLNGEPVLEEFIPMKKTCDGEEENNNEEIVEEPKDIEEKMNWLSSAQLGSCSAELHSEILDFKTNKQSVKPSIPKRNDGEVNRVESDDPIKSCKSQFLGHAFAPFRRYTSFPLEALRNEEENLPGVPGLALQTPRMTNLGDGILDSYLSSKTGPYTTGSTFTSNQSRQQQQQANRKQRRCWSAELHRRFVDALQQLGGTQVATPKQIRELMQVDGLTNDEVKSHLQKYRLHTKRNPVTSASTPNQSGASGKGLGNFGEALKQSNSESDSPQGPLQYGGISRGTSETGGDIMDDEDEEKSESHSWKDHVHSLEKHSV
ncbi:DNA-binding transcription factor [Lithospermum erythrorhizon]|uniref:DNA-binding transcription factor n=1 Tax=Lithospermum erythrorhizon TaxID=34254 RepID=A0AAV3QW30_LITER